MAGPSRTRGFLFADLRGYTDFVERRGDHVAAELLDRYRHIVREHVAAFAGSEVKTEGDSFFVVLDSASSAVRCGLAIAAAASAASSADPTLPVAVGIGIHAGETVETAEGFVGSAVNIAARVCAQARAGEVVVTETVRLLTRTFLDVEFTPLGNRRLKGIPEPVRLYEVRSGATAVPSRVIRPARAVPTVRAPSLLAFGTIAAAIGVVLAVLAAAGAFNGLPPWTSPGPRATSQASTQPAALPPLADIVTYKADATRRGLSPGPGPVAEPGVVWERQVGTTVDGSPIVVSRIVIVATDAGVSAWDAQTGAARWKLRGKFRGTPSASVSDGLAFAADAERVLHAVDVSTGVERWTLGGREVSTDARSIVVDGVLYVGSRDGWAYGLDPATGEVRWQWQAPAEVTDITVLGGTAYVCAKDGRLYAINLADKHERWHVPPTGPAGRMGIPMIDGNTIYLGTSSDEGDVGPGLLYAIDEPTGRIVGRWVSPSGTQTSSAAARNGIAYVATKDDGLYALIGPELRQVIWQADAPAVYTGVALVGDVLYLAGFDGRLLAYQTIDGTKLWELPIAGETHNSSPAVTGGMLFQGDNRGVLRAYIEPTLAALLPDPEPVPSTSPSPAATDPPNPFTIVSAINWSNLGLGVPLEDGLDIGRDGRIYVLDNQPSVTVVDPALGKVVARWGRQGTGSGEFDLTRPDDNVAYGGIAVAPDGLVYVGDGSNHRVQVFTPDGTFLRQFGRTGIGPDELGNISELEIGPDGSVYVLENYQSFVRFDAGGNFEWRAGGPQASDPEMRANHHGLNVRADGRLLMACEGCERLLVIDAQSGALVDHVEASGAPPFAHLSGLLSLDSDGNIYVAQFEPGPAELVFDETGRFLGGFFDGDGRTTAPFHAVNEESTWGNMFWPAPVFAPNGDGFSFNEQGLITLRVSLP